MSESTRSTPLSAVHGYVAVTALGLVLTVVFASAGDFTTIAGPVDFDAYYALVYGFAFLFLAAVYRHRRVA